MPAGYKLKAKYANRRVLQKSCRENFLKIFKKNTCLNNLCEVTRFSVVKLFI